jgi:phage baseplate assembly protein gpV
MAERRTGGASYKTGVVVEAKPGFVRVQFPDLDGLVSDWLPNAQASTTGVREVRTLDVGSHVGCMLDQHFEDGMVVGALYSEADPPPTADPNLILHDFGGGASMAFDRGAGELRLAFGGCTVTVGGAGIKIVGGDLEVEGIQFLPHKHGKVQPGEGDTDVPH